MIRRIQAESPQGQHALLQWSENTLRVGNDDVISNEGHEEHGSLLLGETRRLLFAVVRLFRELFTTGMNPVSEPLCFVQLIERDGADI